MARIVDCLDLRTSCCQRTMALSRGHIPELSVFKYRSSAQVLLHSSPHPNQTQITNPTKLSNTMQTRAMKQKALADGAPAADPTALGTSPDTTPVIKLKPEDRSRPSWDSVCVDDNCPIKHPHHFGLRPRHGAHAAVSTAHGYPDTQPPPLIKAMIDTIRMDLDITTIYESFTHILQDFYRAHAHGGRSDKYHGPAGMFGLGVYVTQNVDGYGVCVTHKHPECDFMAMWFEFVSPVFGIRPMYTHPEGEGNGEIAHG